MGPARAPDLGASTAPAGQCLLVFFSNDDFDRARTLGTALAGEPHRNPNTGTMQFALRDPDANNVMVSATES